MLVCSQPRIWNYLLLFALFSKLIALLVTLSGRRRETLKGSKYYAVLYCGIILNVNAFFFWSWIRNRCRFFDMSKCHIPLLREWLYILRSSSRPLSLEWRRRILSCYRVCHLPVRHERSGQSQCVEPSSAHGSSRALHVTVQTPAQRAEISEPPRLWTVRASDESSQTAALPTADAPQVRRECQFAPSSLRRPMK